MHGTELCSRNLPGGSLWLPAASFEGNGSTPPSPHDSLFWPEPVSRSGLSLSRNDCPFPGHHSEVKAPGLLLRRPTRRVSSSFDFRLPGLFRFAPVRARSSPEIRCLISARHFRHFLESPLPFRGSTLPDQSVQLDSLTRGSPSGSVRLPFAPQN